MYKRVSVRVGWRRRIRVTMLVVARVRFVVQIAFVVVGAAFKAENKKTTTKSGSYNYNYNSNPCTVAGVCQVVDSCCCCCYSYIFCSPVRTAAWEQQKPEGVGADLNLIEASQLIASNCSCFCRFSRWSLVFFVRLQSRVDRRRKIFGARLLFNSFYFGVQFVV